MLLLQNCLSLLMLFIGDIHKLITYCTVVESFFVMLSVTGLLYMRKTKPNITRPIKVYLVVPVVFVLLCFFLIVMPCVEAPYEVGMGALITASGVPAYYFGVCWKTKPRWFQAIMCRSLFKLIFNKLHYFIFR